MQWRQHGWRACHASFWLAISLLFASTAHAFDLKDLSRQLSKPAVIRGPFIQEKHLRALPQPLVSQGTFVLAKEYGLLWLLKTPLQQDYRINSQGIARRDATGWQMLPGKSAGAQQNHLFFAVLQGDSVELERDFELNLQGDGHAWTLQLTPRSLLLKQVFTRIDISGGAYVQRIQLAESQGDSTVLRMPDSTSSASLNDSERADLAQ
ncbi:outer membrane lipoprotein carrier protein LolA [Pseudomonas coleopterorum]|uniref:outer membrane lipoprotein carrier protein LolA n=1 Tax=Pseudomonas coleopterorum TaxID=1605838 RepID=UPI002A6AFFCF|nr:outer membrane lipoprotein carrier protein LolA [Pseudomonas coleopterorum]MDY1046796.1 outer membrane lipoprotein carrier protein LolA [Pseudomonas coleopterorum]